MREVASNDSPLISPVGKRWLRHHRIACSEAMLCIAGFQSSGENPYITRPRLDPRGLQPDYWFDRKDILIKHGFRWLLRHQYKHYLHEEQETGHGRLTIFGKRLPETICLALHGSLKPLSEIIDPPPQFLAHGLDAQVISAKTTGDKVILRFRMNWLKVKRISPY